MCWNAEVSLNTFVFTCFTLAFVYYNNEYTQYKLNEFKNKWLYIFLFLVFLIQLFEYFIWKNLKNKYNPFFTKLLFVTIYLQPIASLMLLSNLTIRNALLIPYAIVGIPYMINIIKTNTINSTVSNGHLVWHNYKFVYKGIKYNKLMYFIYAFFLLFSFFYESNWTYLIFGFLTMSIFIYKEYSTSSSMWCWAVNSIGFYMLGYILFYLPLVEKGLC
jgi:hypothetical protein